MVSSREDGPTGAAAPEGGAGGDEVTGGATSGGPAAAAGGGEVTDGAGPEGQGMVRASVWVTAAFTVVAALAAALPDVFMPVLVPLALVMFAVGCGAFLWAYAIAIGRSRAEAVDLAGLVVLAGGVAPPRVRRSLRGVLAVQVVVGLAAAAVRPFTALAFAVLAPMWGLGVMALWAARHGRFPARPEGG